MRTALVLIGMILLCLIGAGCLVYGIERAFGFFFFMMFLLAMTLLAFSEFLKDAAEEVEGDGTDG